MVEKKKASNEQAGGGAAAEAQGVRLLQEECVSERSREALYGIQEHAFKVKSLLAVLGGSLSLSENDFSGEDGDTDAVEEFVRARHVVEIAEEETQRLLDLMNDQIM